jgi:hypothetical protein
MSRPGRSPMGRSSKRQQPIEDSRLCRTCQAPKPRSDVDHTDVGADPRRMLDTCSVTSRLFASLDPGCAGLTALTSPARVSPSVYGRPRRNHNSWWSTAVQNVSFSGGFVDMVTGGACGSANELVASARTLVAGSYTSAPNHRRGARPRFHELSLGCPMPSRIGTDGSSVGAP